MQRRSRVVSVISVFAMLGLAACAAPKEPSGFLTSYEGFKPGPADTVDKYWVPAGITSDAAFQASLRPYDKVIIDPIWVSLAKDGDAYDGLNPKALTELTDLFRKELIDAVSDRYAVVDKPGPGVMRLSMALTGIERPNRVLAATSTFMPIGIGISVASRVVTGEHTNVGSASMEALASDSVSNKPLFAAIDRHPGGKNPLKIYDTLTDAKSAISRWAKRFRRVLDRSR
jgi:hypothetical protein